MPEGDTIWRTANALRPRLVGKRLLSVTPEPFRRLEGATVIAVSDVSGGIYNDKGLDVPGLLAHSAQGKPAELLPAK